MPQGTLLPCLQGKPDPLLTLLKVGITAPSLVILADAATKLTWGAPPAGTLSLYSLAVVIAFGWLGRAAGASAFAVSILAIMCAMPSIHSFYVLPEYTPRLFGHVVTVIVFVLARSLPWEFACCPSKLASVLTETPRNTAVALVMTDGKKESRIIPWTLIDTPAVEDDQLVAEEQDNVILLHPVPPIAPPLRIMQQSETVERAIGVSIENIVLLKMFWKAVTSQPPESIDSEASQALLAEKLKGFMAGKEAFEEVAGVTMNQALLLRTVWDGFNLGPVEDITREQLERAVVEIGGAKLELHFRKPALVPAPPLAAVATPGPENEKTPPA